MSKSTQFFGTSDDLKEVFEIVEKKGQLQFVRAGRSDTISPTVFSKSADIPNLGIASNESSVACNSYLVSKTGLQIHARKLASAPFFAFDQLSNPKTVMFTAGGIWKNEILIRGSIGTASADPDSLGLMNIFRAAFKKVFSNVRGVFVGAEAESLWKQGARLTGAEQSPAEFDLAP